MPGTSEDASSINRQEDQLSKVFRIMFRILVPLLLLLLAFDMVRVRVCRHKRDAIQRAVELSVDSWIHANANARSRDLFFSGGQSENGTYTSIALSRDFRWLNSSTREQELHLKLDIFWEGGIFGRSPVLIVDDVAPKGVQFTALLEEALQAIPCGTRRVSGLPSGTSKRFMIDETIEMGVGCCIWVLVLLIAARSIVLIIQGIRGRMEDLLPRCKCCSYVIVGLPRPICPECGSALGLGTVVWGTRKRSAGRIAAGVLGLVSIYFLLTLADIARII